MTSRSDESYHPVSVASDGSSFCVMLSSDGADSWGWNYLGDLCNGTTGGSDGDNGYDTPQAVEFPSWL